jgi:hypothetical protein
MGAHPVASRWRGQSRHPREQFKIGKKRVTCGADGGIITDMDAAPVMEAAGIKRMPLNAVEFS